MARLGHTVFGSMLMADAYEDGHEQGCAESRTQALEDMKLGAFG
jgi:hypothetical protein